METAATIGREKDMWSVSIASPLQATHRETTPRSVDVAPFRRVAALRNGSQSRRRE